MAIAGRAALALALSAGCSSGSAAVLSVEITPTTGGQLIQPDSLRYSTSAGESFSITRVSYLLSNFALQRLDGSWLQLSNSVAWLDMEKGRGSFQLESSAPGSYQALRFFVGLAPEANHAGVAKYAAGHPLNPNLNGLHWSWQGGFIFLALEGMWRNPSGVLDGWSYHLARDTNRVAVEVTVPLDLRLDTKLSLDFDILRLINGPQPLSFSRDGSSTHSRDADPVAAALVRNLPAAFQVRSATRLVPAAPSQPPGLPLYLPSKFTPYRFRTSATFPIPALPRDNPLTEERVGLGRALFNDPLLSKDGTISCASCHNAKHAFSDTKRFSRGVQNQAGARNAMPLFNLAWKSSFFWDGRAPSLRTQALMPIQDHSEMDENLTNLVAKLSGSASGKGQTNSADYALRFSAAFGSAEVTAEKIGLALEAFVLTLTSFDSKFDRMTRGETQFDAREQRGLELFMTEYDPRRGQFGADCFHCHGGPLFHSQTFANNGLDSEFSDPGRAKVTGKDADRGKFATPSLRNVAVTGPYMHDGRFDTLEQVVAHYCSGVKRSVTLDPNLAKHPNGGVPLSAADQRALVAFLKTLTDLQFANDGVAGRTPD